MSRSNRNRRSPRPTCAAALVLVAGWLVVASAASAQNYSQLKFDKAAKNANRTMTNRVLGGMPLQPNITAFRTYFQNAFAEMTRIDSIGAVGDMRWAMLVQIRKAKNPEALAEFNRIALIGARKLCKGNYHPAARYNIALIVGDLDQELSTGFGSAAKPPVPLPDAVPVLLDFLNDGQVVDAVKVAALVGLKRHARYGLAPPTRALVSQAVLSLLAEKETPASRTPEGHLWMRRQAAEVLGTIGDPGKQNEVLTALQTVLTDEDEDIALRCSVANAIGDLKFAQNAKIDADTLVGQLGDLAVGIIADEVAAAEKELKAQQAAAAGFGGAGGRGGVFPGRSGGYGRGGYGEGGYGEGGYGAGGYGGRGFGVVDETEDEGVFPRRQLAERIGCLRRGLASVTPRASQQPKALGGNMLKWLDAIQKLIEDMQQDDATLVTEVTRIRGDMEAEIRKGQAPAPPAATPPAAEKTPEVAKTTAP